MPKLRLISPDTTPPGGFRFELNGKRFHAWTVPAITAQVLAFCRANDLPAPATPEADIVHFTCKELQGQGCEGAGIQASFATIKTIMAGFAALAGWVAAGRPLDPGAATRAAVCVHCALNVDATDCAPCTVPMVTRTLDGLRGSARTPHDAALRACRVCGCHLRVKVHVPLAHLRGDPAAYPDWCWLRREHETLNPA